MLLRKNTPILIFLAAAFFGLIVTYAVYKSARDAEQANFQLIAEDVSGRILDRVNQHIALLNATRAIFQSLDGEVPYKTFRELVASMDIGGRYNGIQGIGFARLISASEVDAAEIELQKNYNLDRKIFPETTQAVRSPIVLLEPKDDRNADALGFDMYQQADRRSAMQKAALTSEPAATNPVELVQENQGPKQAGFLAYFPLFVEGNTSNFIAGSNSGLIGFVYAPFRVGELHRAALSNRSEALANLAIQTIDITAGLNETIFSSQDLTADILEDASYKKQTVEFLDRTWEIRVYDTGGFLAARSSNYGLLLCIITLILAGALAASWRSQIKSLQAAEELRLVSEKSAAEKDMMLQEMKHRIKNSIARINAIARQTIRSAKDLSDFSNSFSSRLQSMANAQDLLTRSKWQTADLRELLLGELEQVFGNGLDRISLSSTMVHLNETQTQAFGLVFHELATNALKYGAMANENGKLSVNWAIEGAGKKSKLILHWHETGIATPIENVRVSGGFGTKLINANVIGELGGMFKRELSDNDLNISIEVPYDE